MLRYHYAAGRLERDPDWAAPYRVLPDGEQSYGWDPVIAAGDVWFMDNGDNVFGTSFRGGGVARGPLHVWRVSVADAVDREMFTPFDLPHGTIVNPPLVDPDRRLVVAYDSGNDRLAAFRFGGPGRFARCWERRFGASSHFLLYRDTGEIVVNDFRDEAGEHVVVLDVATGAERGRVATGSLVQSVVFPAPGFGRELYACTFTTLTRVSVIDSSYGRSRTGGSSALGACSRKNPRRIRRAAAGGSRCPSDPDVGFEPRRLDEPQDPVDSNLLQASRQDPRHGATGEAGARGKLRVREPPATHLPEDGGDQLRLDYGLQPAALRNAEQL